MAHGALLRHEKTRPSYENILDYSDQRATDISYPRELIEKGIEP